MVEASSVKGFAKKFKTKVKKVTVRYKGVTFNIHSDGGKVGYSEVLTLSSKVDVDTFVEKFGLTKSFIKKYNRTDKSDLKEDPNAMDLSCYLSRAEFSTALPEVQKFIETLISSDKIAVPARLNKSNSNIGIEIKRSSEYSDYAYSKSAGRYRPAKGAKLKKINNSIAIKLAGSILDAEYIKQMKKLNKEKSGLRKVRDGINM